MFNKLELNNKITSLKEKIKITKTQIIQKLIKRISFLKQKLNNNPKLIKKINIIAEEIKTLKKLNFRYIVKSTLLLETTAEKILTNQNASPLERCLARFWKTKTLKTILENMKTDFELGKIENLNALKSMGKQTRKKKLKDVSHKTKVLHKKSALKFVEEPAGTKEIISENFKHKKKDQIVVLDNTKVDQKQKKKIIMQKMLQHSFNIEEKNSNVENTEDSFFVTSSGQYYLAAVPEASEENRDKIQNAKNIKTEPFKNTDLHPSWKAKQRQQEVKTFRGKKNIFTKESSKHVQLIEAKNSESIDSIIHPSWIAKQKSKPYIAEFGGKKIKFN